MTVKLQPDLAYHGKPLPAHRWLGGIHADQQAGQGTQNVAFQATASGRRQYQKAQDINGLRTFPTESHERDPVCRSARQNLRAAQRMKGLRKLRELRKP